MNEPWWAKGVKQDWPDMTDDELEFAFDLAWNRGVIFVEGDAPERLVVTRNRPKLHGPFEKALEPVEPALFREMLEKGVVERNDNLSGPDEPAGTYCCTRAWERYAYFLYRDGGARPWELYRRRGMEPPPEHPPEKP